MLLVCIALTQSSFTNWLFYMSGILSRRTALKTLMAGSAMAAFPVAGGLYGQQKEAGMPEVTKLTDIPGDGKTHIADPLQTYLNQLAAKGGGVAVLPIGRYILEKTLLIPSRVHLIGEGAGTILTGYRPDGINGLALLSNDGIVTKRGYDGAHDFSVQNLTIDSPRTNGIVLVHASNAYFSHIYGVDAHHHHFDIAGSRNVITENIFLTGRSGTAPYQIDGNPFNNNIWNGKERVRPIRDNTINDGIFLSDSVIRPTNRPNHGIHLHRRGGKNIFVDNVVVENVENGIYRDRNCSREDVIFTNVVIRNVSNRGVNFRRSETRDQRVAFQNVSVVESECPIGFEYHACEDLTMQNVKVLATANADAFALVDIEGGSGAELLSRGESGETAVKLRDSRNIFLTRISARNFPVTLRLESCTNIQCSGFMATDSEGNPVTPEISGTECLAKWQSS